MSDLLHFLLNVYAWARARWKRLAILLLSILLPLAVFGALAEDVWTQGGLPWDAPTLRWIHQFDTPARDRVMLLITRSGYAWGTVPLAIAVLAWLLFRRSWREARFFTFAFGGAVLINGLVKLLFHRLRPSLWVSLAPETSYSFPSGHATASMALVASLVVLTWPTRGRWWVLVPGALFVLLVGLSRMYLGVHYPSDVLAAWTASLAWVAGVAHLTFGGVLRPHRERGG